jgi:hypothetical protein
MNNTEAFDLLRTIVRSAHFTVLESFTAATAEARRAVLSVGGGSRAVHPLAEVAVDHADKLLKSTWERIEPALDRLHLDWTAGILRELQAELGEMLAPTAARLFEGVRIKQAAFPDVVAAAEQRIRNALETHTQAAEAQLVLYVADRRRKEIRDVLSELERRLVTTGGDDTLLESVRGARREADASSPDEGKLKRGLKCCRRLSKASAQRATLVSNFRR